MTQPVDDRSPIAQALSKVTQVTSISLMTIIPAIIGYLTDQYFHTLILFTAIGLVLGMASAIWQLIKFVALQDQSQDPIQDEDSGGNPPSEL